MSRVTGVAASLTSQCRATSPSRSTAKEWSSCQVMEMPDVDADSRALPKYRGQENPGSTVLCIAQAPAGLRTQTEV
jgi:hypothetical protein